MGYNVSAVGLETKSIKHELKKHAASIHCSNTLTLLQRKISNALLYHAYQELLLKEEHEITIKQLCRLISYQGNNHSAIKDALKGLLSTVIEWNVVNDTTGAEDWTASSILASVSLRGPICLYAYSPRMKQLLHSPSMFGKINLFIQSRFKSSYGLALYENCIRYRGLPFTKWFEMDVFRKLMGVPDDKYPIFRDFKRRVLDKSVEEVNTYSDLFVALEIGKEGRQASKVRFCLKERPKKMRLGTRVGEIATSTGEDDEESEILKEKLTRQFGLTKEQIQQVLSEYEVEFISEKIAIIETSRNYQLGKVQNSAGYLLSALKNNYQVGKTSAAPIQVKKIKMAEQQEHYQKMKREVDHIRQEYATYREQQIDLVIAALSKHDKESFLQHFEEQAAHAIQTVLQLQRNKYTRETVLNSPQIKALLRQFAVEELSYLQDQLITVELFVTTLSLPRQSAWREFQTESAEAEIALEN